MKKGFKLGIFSICFVATILLASSVHATLDFNTVRATTGNFVQNLVGLISDISKPILEPILGAGSSSDIFFLKCMAFLLVLIVIIGTLDAVNVFGGGTRSSKWINFIIGLIVSIIGVRFMPDNIWLSLSAPSSALIATLLVGIPFFALGFISVKIQSSLVSKVLWLFYVIFMSYLIFGYIQENDFMWIYGIFLLLGAIMLFFDSTMRRIFFREKYKIEVENKISKMNILNRGKLRAEIMKWNDIIGDSTASAADRTAAKGEIRRLEGLYGDLSSI